MSAYDPKRTLRLEFRALTAGIYRGFACDNLLKEFWSDGNFARKWATICGDQQYGRCNARCKEGQRDSAAEPVAAVNHGNGDQGVEPLKLIPAAPTAVWLITRWRLASSAVWSAFTISGCAARWLSSAGFRASVSCNSWQVWARSRGSLADAPSPSIPYSRRRLHGG
jgi:hypothetical protein